jgi:hypothetical protein
MAKSFNDLLENRERKSRENTHKKGFTIAAIGSTEHTGIA